MIAHVADNLDHKANLKRGALGTAVISRGQPTVANAVMIPADADNPLHKQGGGIIPFAKHNGQVQFLFQTVFSGRKAGYLIDFGGGSDPGEDCRATAIREFVEETETLYFADSLTLARRSPEAVGRQAALVGDLFEQTLRKAPHWCCERASSNPLKPKQWQTFFIEFPYRDVSPLNLQWATDTSGRFKKRRELAWIDGDELLQIYKTAPKRLWKRVRQLNNAPGVVAEIIRVIGD